MLSLLIDRNVRPWMECPHFEFSSWKVLTQLSLSFKLPQLKLVPINYFMDEGRIFEKGR